MYRVPKHLSSRRIRPLFLILMVLSLLMLYLAGVSAPTAAQGEVLLDDQFNDNSNNWQASTEKDTTFDIADGVLTFELNKENIINFATPEATFPDNIEVEVEATTPEPPTTGNWIVALIIRADTRDLTTAFYQFEVTGKGEWAFVTRTARGKEYKIQKSGKLRSFDPAKPSTLKVSADGNIFTFSVNGTKVGTFEDDTINNDPSTEKHVGVLGGTFKDTDSVKVEFRNFIVTSNAGTDIGATPTTVRRSPTPARRTPTPRRTVARPTPTEVASGEILLEENFDTDNPNDWPVGTSANSRTKIEKNTLVVEVLKREITQVSRPRAIKFPANIDVSVTAKVTNPHSSGNWGFGLGVRDHTIDNVRHMYIFEVLGNGSYAFLRYSDTDKFQTIAKAKIQGVKFDPKAANTIRFVAVDNHFEFYLNDEKIGEADDDTIEAPAESSILVDASTYGTVASLKVTFSNFAAKSAG